MARGFSVRDHEKYLPGLKLRIPYFYKISGKNFFVDFGEIFGT